MVRIKEARERARKKQQECADAVGVTLRAWQTYEQGQREPKYDILCKIADLFHVSTDYLLGRDTSDSDISNITTQFDLSPLERQILEKYLMLLEDKRDSILEWLKKSVNEDNEDGGD